MLTLPLAVLALILTVSSAAHAADLKSLSVDPAQSRIDVAVHATVDSFVGTLSHYKAAIAINPVDGRIGSASLSFAFSDLKTGKSDRDAKMLSWEQSTRYPDASFVLGSLKQTSEDEYRVTGTFTMHGVSRQITFPVSVTTDHKTYAVDGSAKLDTRDYGLPIIRVALFLKVDPVVVIHFHLQATAN